MTHIICTWSHIMHTNCKVGRISHMSAFPCMPPPHRPPAPPSFLFSDVFFMLTLCSALGTLCGFPPYTALPNPFRMSLWDNIVFIFQLNFYTFVFFPPCLLLRVAIFPHTISLCADFLFSVLFVWLPTLFWSETETTRQQQWNNQYNIYWVDQRLEFKVLVVLSKSNNKMKVTTIMRLNFEILLLYLSNSK